VKSLKRGLVYSRSFFEPDECHSMTTVFRSYSLRLIFRIFHNHPRHYHLLPTSLYSSSHFNLTIGKESGDKAIYYFNAEPPVRGVGLFTIAIGGELRALGGCAGGSKTNNALSILSPFAEWVIIR